jgi:hypothetical protein
MMMPQAMAGMKTYPLDIVGSNTFGRNPKISPSQTFNMFISDNFLVDMTGYKKVLNVPQSAGGRGTFRSERGNFFIAVIGNAVYRISGPDTFLSYQFISNINTFFGDVSIDENIANQIAICDGQALWIYNWVAGTFQAAVLPISQKTDQPITPGYVTYHDGYFIVPDVVTSDWYLSKANNGLIWNWGAGSTYVFGSVQTKPTNCVAVLRAPGRGSLIWVFGTDVTEPWQDTGAQLFPYQRNSSSSIDYGCLSSTTIAAMDNYIAFLGSNEKSGPAILVSQGGNFERLSTDGIDFLLADLVAPETSTAFFYRLDGHVFYQITFYDPRDNYTLVYDFNTKKFFYATDESMNFHIAASICFYNETYYFVSLKDSSIYELNSKYFTYDYNLLNGAYSYDIDYQIPCVRICSSLEQDDTNPRVYNRLMFEVEQGVDPNYALYENYFASGEDGFIIAQEAAYGYVGYWATQEIRVESYAPRIDITISKDSGQTFGNASQKFLNTQGNRKNRVIFWNLGQANDFVVQLRFWSRYRKTISNGIIEARPRTN